MNLRNRFRPIHWLVIGFVFAPQSASLASYPVSSMYGASTDPFSSESGTVVAARSPFRQIFRLQTSALIPDATAPSAGDFGTGDVVSSLPIQSAGVDVPAKLEDVVLAFKISHPRRSDLEVWLTSPSGKAWLVRPAGGAAGKDLLFTGARSSAFAGLSPLGNWKLKVVDVVAGSAGTLQGWSLQFPRSATACQNYASSSAPIKVGPSPLPTTASIVTTNAPDVVVGEIALSYVVQSASPAELTIDLVSPRGTKVRLHDRESTGTTLAAKKKPLRDFMGESAYGKWRIELTTKGAMPQATLEGLSVDLGDTDCGPIVLACSYNTAGEVVGASCPEGLTCAGGTAGPGRCVLIDASKAKRPSWSSFLSLSYVSDLAKFSVGQVYSSSGWTKPSCDCSLGALDPDCLLTKGGAATGTSCSLPTQQCINAFGKCEVPNWNIADTAYADGKVCNCDSGTPDPDCANTTLPVACSLQSTTLGEAMKCDATSNRCVPKDWTCDTKLYATSNIGGPEAKTASQQCSCGAQEPDTGKCASSDFRCLPQSSFWACGDPDQKWPASLGSKYNEVARGMGGASCDCGFGAYDPDCDHHTLPISGCGSNSAWPTVACSKVDGSCGSAASLLKVNALYLNGRSAGEKVRPVQGAIAATQYAKDGWSYWNDVTFDGAADVGIGAPPSSMLLLPKSGVDSSAANITTDSTGRFKNIAVNWNARYRLHTNKWIVIDYLDTYCTLDQACVVYTHSAGGLLIEKLLDEDYGDKHHWNILKVYESASARGGTDIASWTMAIATGLAPNAAQALCGETIAEIPVVDPLAVMPIDCDLEEGNTPLFDHSDTKGIPISYAAGSGWQTCDGIGCKLAMALASSVIDGDDDNVLPIKSACGCEPVDNDDVDHCNDVSCKRLATRMCEFGDTNCVFDLGHDAMKRTTNDASDHPHNRWRRQVRTILGMSPTSGSGEIGNTTFLNKQ